MLAAAGGAALVGPPWVGVDLTGSGAPAVPGTAGGVPHLSGTGRVALSLGS